MKMKSFSNSDSPVLPLFQTFPALKEHIPHISLGRFPTPVRRMAALGKKLGHPNLYIKDDGLTGSELGGNKVRKLEFLLGDAIKKKATDVITFGAAGSNHCAATAFYANQLGLTCTSILIAQENHSYVGKNILLGAACGAELHHFSHPISAYIPGIMIYVRKLLKTGRIPYIIPMGGSNPPGIIGYVNAAFELKEQIISGYIPKPDTIFVPMGSMGTAIGLMIGLKAAGLTCKVIPVRVIEKTVANKEKFRKLFHTTVRFLQQSDSTFPNVELESQEPIIEEGYLGKGYAQYTREGKDAIDLIAYTEGIRLEGTYTGKTLAALMDYAKKPDKKEEMLLFWNTANAIDFSSLIKDVDYRRLPKAFHKYVESS